MEKKKTIACTDVVPGCGFKAEAESESELMKEIATHAAEAHGVKEVGPELLEKVKAAIKSEG